MPRDCQTGPGWSSLSSASLPSPEYYLLVGNDCIRNDFDHSDFDSSDLDSSDFNRSDCSRNDCDGSDCEKETSVKYRRAKSVDQSMYRSASRRHPILHLLRSMRSTRPPALAFPSTRPSLMASKGRAL